MVETNSRASIGPAIVTSSVERRAFVDQHVGPARGEALILDHVLARHPELDLIDVRDRVCRVADVFVEGSVIRRRRAARTKARPALAE